MKRLILLAIIVFLIGCEKDNPLNDNSLSNLDSEAIIPIFPEDQMNIEEPPTYIQWNIHKDNVQNTNFVYDVYLKELSSDFLQIGKNSIENKISLDNPLSQGSYAWKVVVKNQEQRVLAESEVFTFEIKERPEKIYEGDVRLTNQEEINNFGKEHYTKINGSLIISDHKHNAIPDDPILDLSPLSSLKSIEFSLSLYRNFSLTNTKGLQNIEKVREISFFQNFRLKTIDGLEKITTADQLRITKNHELIDISSLRNLSSLKLDLELIENHSLTSLNGLDNLELVGRDIILSQNLELRSLEQLNGIKTVRDLTITGNEKISNLEGFNQLTEVRWLVISRNYNLTSIEQLDKLTSAFLISIRENNLENYEGLHNITSVTTLTLSGGLGKVISLEGFRNLSTIESNFRIEFHPALTSLDGLQKLSHVGGTFTILSTGLTNLGELTNLRTIKEDLIIRFNHQLVSLEGLQNLTTLENDLFLDENLILKSLTGLNISPKNNLTIKDNPELVDFCSLDVQTINSSGYNIIGNNYNPKYQDLVDGNCTL